MAGVATGTAGAVASGPTTGVAVGTLVGVVALLWPSSLGDSSLYAEEQLQTLKEGRIRVRLAEGEPPHRYTLRQTREKLCGDGLAGLRHAMFTTLLFVQGLVYFREKNHLTCRLTGSENE
ncbi:hypothetical protein [Pseudomonas lundensis]|uniref:hypothetical protein n=1 Tax=Pseudomonas lundensis TaxID=86185 RepID=UPI003B97ED12